MLHLCCTSCDGRARARRARPSQTQRVRVATGKIRIAQSRIRHRIGASMCDATRCTITVEWARAEALRGAGGASILTATQGRALGEADANVEHITGIIPAGFTKLSLLAGETQKAISEQLVKATTHAATKGLRAYAVRRGEELREEAIANAQETDPHYDAQTASVRKRAISKTRLPDMGMHAARITSGRRPVVRDAALLRRGKAVVFVGHVCKFLQRWKRAHRSDRAVACSVRDRVERKVPFWCSLGIGRHADLTVLVSHEGVWQATQPRQDFSVPCGLL